MSALAACVSLLAGGGPRPEPPGSGSDAAIYRRSTARLLRRYMKLSLETGRLPSPLGQLHFRQRLSSYPLHTFEDAVIFVHDVEGCLKRLDVFEQQVLAHCVLQEYTAEEAAGLLGVTSRTVERRLPQALDNLTGIFLQRDLMERRVEPEKTCQEGKNDDLFVSGSKDGK
jgi:hypothetical protein